MSYYGEHTLDLTNYKDLTLIVGENQSESGANSNGSGKSSLIANSVCYALFGQDRNLKPDDFINEEALKESDPNCYASVEIEDGKDTYIIVRYRKSKEHKNNVYVIKNGKDITREAAVKDTDALIEEILGLDYNTFTSCIYLPQNFVSFADIKNTDRKVILTSILKLDVFDKAQLRTKDKLKVLEGNVNIINSELLRLNANKEELGSINYKLQMENFEDIRNQNIKNLTNNINNITYKIKDLENKNKEKIVNINNQVNTLEKNLKVKEVEISETDNISNILLTLREKCGKILAKVSIFENEILELKEEYKDRENVGTGECPVCYQEITKDKLQENLNNINNKIIERKENIKKLNNGLELIKKEEKINKDKLNTFENTKKEITSLKRQIDNYNHEIINLKNNTEVKENLKTIEGLREKSIFITNQENPHKNNYKLQEERLNKISSEIIIKEKSIKKLEKIKNYLNFWIEGFSNKGIKSILMDGIINNLTEKTNKYIDELSGGTIKIEYSTTKELKTGGWTDAFDILIYTEDGVSRRKYENYSGGQKQKIKLAISWALADLISERLDKNYDIEIIDECDHSLDETGRSKIIDCLQKRNKNIFLITQYSDLQNRFDNVIKVIYENGRSRIDE